MPTATATPELDRLIAALREDDLRIADAVAAAAGNWHGPLRIQVTGRARAGKSTVLRALALASARETGPVDEPGAPDPELDGDIVIYVLSAAAHPADRRILATLPAERTLVLLNKADAIGSRWADAVAAAQRYTDELGIATLPVVAALAEDTRAGAPSETDLRTLRAHLDRADSSFTLSPELFTAPTAGPDVAERQAVLDRWGLHGAACLLSALRRDPELRPQPLLRLLHAVSGIEAVHALLRHRCDRAAALRGGDLLDELTRLAARALPRAHDRAHDLLDEYLAGDEALWLGLHAGLACPDVAHPAAEYSAPTPADAADALARAQRWRAVVAGNATPAARRAAIRVHNGYVRLWERMSSAGL
ncbi:hypothetical protein GZH49_28040 [Nocardia terpenica]|uniref:hypothetical protein n=1 Tax=Nocardia terpenica TaxID=455432 RepID=UPI002FE138F1